MGNQADDCFKPDVPSLVTLRSLALQVFHQASSKALISSTPAPLCCRFPLPTPVAMNCNLDRGGEL